MIKVKGWSSFQHYRDRNPPWIKLDTKTFQNYDFACLQDASKLLAICIWTLASRYKDPQAGMVPDDLAWIKSQCGLGASVTEENLNELENKGFIERASKMLARCKQDAIPETETETETEDRGQKEKKDKRASDEKSGGKKPKSQQSQKPDDVSDQVWADFIAHRKAKKATVTGTVIAGIRKQAEKAAFSLEDALAECCLRGWQGFNADWIDEKEKARRFAQRTQKEQEEDRKAVMG